MHFWNKITFLQESNVVLKKICLVNSRKKFGRRDISKCMRTSFALYESMYVLQSCAIRFLKGILNSTL